MRLLTTVLLVTFAATSYAHTRTPETVGYTYIPAGYSTPRLNQHEAAFYGCKKCYYPREYRANEVNSPRKHASFNRFAAHSWVTPLSVEHYCR